MAVTFTIKNTLTGVVITAFVVSLFAVVLCHFLVRREEPISVKLLIDGPNCKVPDVDPMPIRLVPVRRENLRKCDGTVALTSIKSTNHPDDPLNIQIEFDKFSEYGVTSVDCCYQIAYRIKENDFKVQIQDECTPFEHMQELDKRSETIFVKCSSGGREIYRNVHSVIAQKEHYEVRQAKAGLNREKAYNVAMIGLDEISRLNMERGMSNMTDYLRNHNEWIDMKGYTRISTETFSNLFALLTGQSPTTTTENCDPTSNTFLNGCGFIWKDFQNAGYVTTFAEDQRNRSSFHQRHKGFNEDPVDHYFRPSVLTIEQEMHIRKHRDLALCAGPMLYLNNIFVYCLKMMAVHEFNPHFGLFYVNSLGSRQLKSAPALDNSITQFFNSSMAELNTRNTIFIYFSDSGTRFEAGSTGFYEERFPFLYFRLPQRFVENHPDLVANLRNNANRLTTPYDLHITLRHILNLSAEKKVSKKATGCPKCASLFDVIPVERSSEDVNIPDDSNPCSLQDLNVWKNVVWFAARYAVDELNKKLEPMKAANKTCATLYLKEVNSAHQQLTSPYNMNYIVRFTVLPSNAQFEALLRRKFSSVVMPSPQFEKILDITLLNDEKGFEVCFDPTKPKRKPKGKPKKGVKPKKRSELDDDDYEELSFDELIF